MQLSNLKISLIAVLAVVMCAGMASAAPDGNGDGDRQRDSQRERGDRGDKAERGEKGERGERRRGGAKALFEGIDLSDEQKKSVREVMQNKKAERDEIRSEMRDARESGDQEAMKAVGEKMQALMDATHESVRAELTADQQTQFDANLAKLQERAAERRANRGERKNKGEGKKGKKKTKHDTE